MPIFVCRPARSRGGGGGGIEQRTFFEGSPAFEIAQRAFDTLAYHHRLAKCVCGVFCHIQQKINGAVSSNVGAGGTMLLLLPSSSTWSQFHSTIITIRILL